MIILRIFNNNVVLVKDENNVENILLGKGLAFQKKVGSEVDACKIEKRFVLGQDTQIEKFNHLLNQFPVSYLELTARIIANTEKELHKTFRDETYIAITDHINYAIEKVKQNIETKNLLLWEIKRFYPKEFETALHALKMIEKFERVKLPEDEAGYLAIHFVNAQYDKDTNADVVVMTAMIKEIIKIIEYHFSIKLDDKSINYDRLITHIRYFAQRVSMNKQIETKDDEFYLHLKKKYPDIVKCVDKIEKYLEKEHNCKITDEEYMYFIVHIGRVLSV